MINDIKFNSPNLLKLCGIYSIKSESTNKIYVGSSKNIRSRLNRHRQALRKNKHDNNHLQNIFNKYGEEDLTISIIVLCDSLNLRKKEAEEIKKIDLNLLINLAPVLDAGQLSSETREKLSAASKLAKRGPWSEERKRKFVESRKQYDLRHTENSKKKIRESNINTKRFLAHKQKRVPFNHCLSIEDVQHIRYFYELGVPIQNILKKYSASPETIYRAAKRKQWKNIPDIERPIYLLEDREDIVYEKYKNKNLKMNSSKLNFNTAEEIRRLSNEGKSNKELTELFSVCERQIWAVRAGKVWNKDNKINYIRQKRRSKKEIILR